MNVICLMGRLTDDPKLSTTPNGTNNCRFRVAVNRPYTNANGERETDFINCIAWRQTAEFISKYFYKGNMIGLTGSLQTRTYIDKDTGKNRTAYDVVISNAFFAESKSSNQNRSTQSYSSHNENGSQNSGGSFSTGDFDGFSTVSTDDGDLPF
jgi:single-strand DNA-binding protein